ncbi:GNAT family N-acetyltransferase [Tsukamurella sp. 8F]|uniref:GNAT family N-acetyltransferase n=1 Tax=unclassified Tsukamurella TaxID=2633480 RepID=UPI0023B886BB|nr:MULTISPECIES: GNAT family N-acetyltransferase [unclassified Tsukamurella]MDF0528482.1 GNAT family N-acetyltransferase [Tsukamurella sp. 8J]MDF0586308.1 GNAT family N-acetyltransferase [Tsukamurella sp. 8F]
MTRARRVTVGEIEPEALAALAARTFPLACPPELSAEAVGAFIADNLSPAAFAAHLADPGAHVYVAGAAAAPVGYGLVLHGVHGDAPGSWVRQRTAYVSKLYVDPGEHGGGIARDLMIAALDGARADGCAAAFLGTNRKNVRARRFYAKQGFEVVGERVFVVGGIDNTDDVLLLALT